MWSTVLYWIECNCTVTGIVVGELTASIIVGYTKRREDSYLTESKGYNIWGKRRTIPYEHARLETPSPEADKEVTNVATDGRS